MAQFTEHIPEDGWRGGVAVVLKADLFSAGEQFGMELVIGAAGDTNAGQVALHIRGEYRHTCIGKAFCENLKRHCLSGPGRTCNQSVAIGPFQQKVLRNTVCAANENTVQLCLPGIRSVRLKGETTRKSACCRLVDQ